jgi:hypothetical protein
MRRIPGKIRNGPPRTRFARECALPFLASLPLATCLLPQVGPTSCYNAVRIAFLLGGEIVNPYNCQLRVLVVSASPLRRAALLNKLRDRFGALFAAEGEGPALLEDARRLVQEERCHAAVVVHDLADPFDPTANLDGLIAQLAPAGIVICAVRPNDRLAFQAGRRSLEYVHFADPASDLCAAVEARGRHGCKCDVAASWPETRFAASTAKRLKLPAEQVSDENLYDLLAACSPRRRRSTCTRWPASTPASWSPPPCGSRSCCWPASAARWSTPGASPR